MKKKFECLSEKNGDNMDEFITAIKNNIGTQCGPDKKSNRFREFLHIISTSNPEIRIIEKCSDEGDVTFEVSMKSLGISYDNLIKYKYEICSDFSANFLGELLVRENIEKFVKIITELKDDYKSKVTKFEHKKFGMKIFRDKFIFVFHISLIQSILTEDFRRKMY